MPLLQGQGELQTHSSDDVYCYCVDCLSMLDVENDDGTSLHHSY